QRGALAHRALGPVTRGIAIRRGHGWRSSPRQAKAQQHAGETGTHVQRSFAGKKPYCTLIASGSRPPRSSLPLASASSDAVPYGPMRTRYTVRPLTWADSTRPPRPSRAVRAVSASAAPEALSGAARRRSGAAVAAGAAPRAEAQQGDPGLERLGVPGGAERACLQQVAGGGVGRRGGRGRRCRRGGAGVRGGCRQGGVVRARKLRRVLFALPGLAPLALLF